MNEQLAKQISDILQSSKDFVVAQAPDAIQQFLGLHQMDAIIGMMTSIGLIFLLFLFLVWLVFYSDFDDEQKILIGVAFIIIFAGLIATSVFDFVKYQQIKHFPKGYLLQRALHPKNGCGS